MQYTTLLGKTVGLALVFDFDDEAIGSTAATGRV